MELIKEIKAELKTAMKEKNTIAKDILRVIIGELTSLSKKAGRTTDILDSEVISVVKKMIESNKTVASEQSLAENNIIGKYLPVKITTENLTIMIEEMVTREKLSGMKSMKVIMGYFSTNFPGQYDGKELSTIAKEKLK